MTSRMCCLYYSMEYSLTIKLAIYTAIIIQDANGGTYDLEPINKY